MKNLYYNFFLIFLILSLIKSGALKIDKNDKLNKRIKILEKKVRTECKVDDCLSCKEGSSNECEKCVEEYVLQNGKCYSKLYYTQFIQLKIYLNFRCKWFE
jgi:hypothetical protein